VKAGEFTSSILQEGGKDRVFKETDEENFLEVLDLGQSGNMVRDDGFASNWEERLGDVEGQWTESSATRRAADENDSLGMHDDV
jgi:hypothetical protein